MPPQIGQTISPQDFAKAQAPSAAPQAGVPQVGQTISPQEFSQSSKPPEVPQPGFLNKFSNGVGKLGEFLGHAAQETIKGPAALATRGGQLLGVGVAKALPNIFDADKAMALVDSPMRTPGFDTEVKPISQETPESVIGQGVSTIALGIPNPTAAGAAFGGGSAMQNNEGPIGVGVKTGLGALGGWAAGKASGALSRAMTPANPLDDALIHSGAAVDVEAPQISKTLQQMGIKSISTPTDQAVARNVLDNTIRNVQNVLKGAAPDSISGQFSPGVSELQKNLQNLLMAQRAVQQVSSVPAAQAAGPGLLGRAIAGAGHLSGKLATGVGLTGAGYFIGKGLEGNNPQNVARRALSGGTLTGK